MEIMVGIYARLSVEHDNKKDCSLEEQIRLAKQWVHERNHISERGKESSQAAGNRHRYTIYDIYKDMGYSGTTFKRPGFQRLIADAEKGYIRCILCKDASRIGRDYLKTGEYLEKIFPMLGVRVICISDPYTVDENAWEYEMPGSLAGNLRNLMNEWYARDIGRRVRLVKQHKKAQGEFVGSVPPYGWKLDVQEGKRILVPDEQLGNVLCLMKSLRQKEMSYGQIADILNQRGIRTPQDYRKSQKVYQREHPEKQGDMMGKSSYRNDGKALSQETQTVSRWDASGVRRIILRSRELQDGAANQNASYENLSHTRGDYHTA